MQKDAPQWLVEERAKARAKRRRSEGLDDDDDDALGEEGEEDDDDDEARRAGGAIEITRVMENELRQAGISAKKGYEEERRVEKG